MRYYSVTLSVIFVGRFLSFAASEEKPRSHQYTKSMENVYLWYENPTLTASEAVQLVGHFLQKKKTRIYCMCNT